MHHNIAEQIGISGRCYVYDGFVTIEEHLSGQIEPAFVLGNMMPTAGRTYLMTGSIADIDGLKIGDDATARSSAMTDLVNPLFAAVPTSSAVSGTKTVIQLYVGIGDANFWHREIGLFAGATLISTLLVAPAFEKTTAKTRTYVYEIGWL